MRSYLTGWFFGWFFPVDTPDNFITLPNGAALDAWEFRLEIKIEDYTQFEICTRPDEFEFLLNGQLATVTHGALPDKLITATANDGITLKRVKTFFPDPITNLDRPQLIIELIANPLHQPLAGNQINVVITDLISGFPVLDITATIAAPYERVYILDNGSFQLNPNVMGGSYFDSQRNY